MLNFSRETLAFVKATEFKAFLKIKHKLGEEDAQMLKGLCVLKELV